MSEKGPPLPKFGEWDVNNPASADGFTVIFNRARDEKKTGDNNRGPQSAFKDPKHAQDASRPNSKKWLCCIHPAQAES